MAKEIFRTSVPGTGESVVVTCTCPSCGADVPAGDAFCGKCGHDLRDAGIPDLSGASCMLVRVGAESARVVPRAGGGAAEAVEVPLPAVSNREDPTFGLERDKYVLFDTSGGVPRVIGCPFNRSGFCSEDGKSPCSDLGGWLCMDDGSGTLFACAVLCHGAVSRDSFAL